MVSGKPSIAILLASIVLLIACQSPVPKQVQPAAQTIKDQSMDSYETEKFNWGFSTSHYYLDMGNTHILTLEQENWMKDAQGNVVADWFGSGNTWGAGGTPMGGQPELKRLPKTMRMSYYDYQEDRFYQLDAELPQKKLYDLFKQKTVSTGANYGTVIPRFNRLLIGIAPQGHVVVWARAAGAVEQLELANYKASVMKGMTVEKYNSSGNYGSNGERAFPIEANRWKKLSYSTSLKPETVEKLRSGWMPPLDYYLQQRIKYPWRYKIIGNGRLLEFTETQGNQEHFQVAPWSLQEYQHSSRMRGIPESAVFWFNDLAGKRHRIFISFYNKDRVAGESDLTPVWEAFQSIFPNQKVEDNDFWPSENDMATVEVQVGDDLKSYSATLVKGDKRVPLPIGETQFFDLEPFAHAPGQATPSPEVIKRLQGGPDVAVH